MKARRYVFPVIVLCLGLLHVTEAQGRGRFKAWDRMPVQLMNWHSSKEQALSRAGRSDPAQPVLCYLRKANGTADRKYNLVVFRNKQIVRASYTAFAAYRVDLDTEEGKALASQYNVKRDGVLLWFDGHGNLVCKKEGSLQARNVTDVVSQWKRVLEKFGKDAEKAFEMAEKLIESGQYKRAIGMLEPIAELRGPLAVEARKLLDEIEALGNKLLDSVDLVGHGRGGRVHILRQIAWDFRETPIRERALEMIKEGPKAKIDKEPAEALAGKEKEKPVDTQLQEEKKTEETLPSEISRALDVDTKDPKEVLTAARELYAKGKTLCRRATEVGDGKLYAKAFDILTEASDLAEVAHVKVPADQSIKKLIEDISLLRYTCFKHQTI